MNRTKIILHPDKFIYIRPIFHLYNGKFNTAMKDMKESCGPYIIQYSPEEKVIRIKAGKGVDFDSSIRVMSQVVHSPYFAPDHRIIIDFREMKYHPSYGELTGITTHLKSLSKSFQKKFAMISVRGPIYYVFELIASICKMAGMEVKIFHSEKDAETWINE